MLFSLILSLLQNTFSATLYEPIVLNYSTGISTSENANDPNPFLDYRLNIVMTSPSNRTLIVPGFYNGNGAGNGSGDVWTVRFAADEVGTWEAIVSFRSGNDINVSLNANDGVPLGPDNREFSFQVTAPNDNAVGFLKSGFLKSDPNGRYLKFTNGQLFVKGGVDSPENFFGYIGFDDTQDENGSFLHHYSAHVQHWQVGDPDWTANNGQNGRGLIGALNYLSSVGVNSIYFLPMNLGGDAQDTWPFINPNGGNVNYDISRMNQWNIAMQHANARGILLHIVLGETESGNSNWLDDGNLGVARKLFYRQLIAMFGYNLGLQWNISEENPFSTSEVNQFQAYIAATDPYDHPITVHTHLDDVSMYNAFPWVRLTSIQYSQDSAEDSIQEANSIFADNVCISLDENAPAGSGLQPDNQNDLRKRILYDVYLNGGQLEWYMGGDDQSLEDFTTRESMWKYMAFARRLLSFLPLQEMQDADNLLSGEDGSYGGGEVFAKDNDIYVIYLPNASDTGDLNLSSTTGAFNGRWIDPRNFTVGDSIVVNSGQVFDLPNPPNNANEDWIFLVTR